MPSVVFVLEPVSVNILNILDRRQCNSPHQHETGSPTARTRPHYGTTNRLRPPPKAVAKGCKTQTHPPWMDHGRRQSRDCKVRGHDNNDRRPRWRKQPPQYDSAFQSRRLRLSRIDGMKTFVMLSLSIPNINYSCKFSFVW